VRRFRERWLRNRTEVFSKRVGKLAAKCADMVIGTDTASFQTFRIARSAGVICVLDHSYAHINTCLRIEQEERLYDPIFSRTFDTYVVDPHNQQNSVDEINLADAIIVASSFAKESLIENGVDEKRIYVVPYGIDLRKFQAVTRQRENSTKHMNILFVGGIGQRKGIGYLLKTVHDLNDSLDITTTLVGSFRGDTSVYEKYRGDFIHLNQISRSQIPSVFQASDVFVFPSLIEGFALVILEAMASGLPVITTTNSGGGGIIVDGVDGFIVPIRDVSAIKERLVYLYENPDKRMEMGLAARKKAELFSWDRYYQEIAKVLDDVYMKQKKPLI
jgi:starch synthase